MDQSRFDTIPILVPRNIRPEDVSSLYRCLVLAGFDSDGWGSPLIHTVRKNGVEFALSFRFQTNLVFITAPKGTDISPLREAVLHFFSPEDETSDSILAQYRSVSSVSSDCLQWQTDKGQTTITGCNQDAAGVLRLPVRLGRAKVTAIAPGAFRLSDLEVIEVPDCVTAIGSSAPFADGAFEACYSLKAVRLPRNLKRLESKTFFWCSKLSEVELPEGLEFIGSHVFCDCESLKTLTIPASVCEISHSAFYSNRNNPWPLPILLRVKEGSEGHRYAAAKKMRFEIIP